MADNLSLWELYNKQNDILNLMKTHTHNITDLYGFSNVASSGDFNDLKNIPNIVNSVNGQVGNVNLNYNDVNAIPKNASCNKNWNYTLKSTQPKYIWGCNDNIDMFIFDPSKFSVYYSTSSSYAYSAGSATSANSAKTANTAKFATSADTCNRAESADWAEEADTCNRAESADWAEDADTCNTAESAKWAEKAAYAVSAGSVTSSGADFAEMFEWKDGNDLNENRLARFVTLDGDKLIYADENSDYILGITSINPFLIGNCYDQEWHDKYIKNEYNIIQYDENNNPIISPEYDESKEYIPRRKRKEWSMVGRIGQLLVHDDGTCMINGYCKSGKDGIATNSNEKTQFRVMKRINKNLILINI